MLAKIKKSYKDLVLTLSKKQFDKIDTSKNIDFKFKDYFINLSILQSSHLININNEIFEFFDVNTKENNCLFSKNILTFKNVYYNFDNFTYLFRLTNKFKEDSYNLEFNYTDSDEVNPESKISLKRFDKMVKICTAHYYSSEFTTIYTETIIKFKK
jgi:hypothetical protein